VTPGSCRWAPTVRDQHHRQLPAGSREFRGLARRPGARCGAGAGDPRRRPRVGWSTSGTPCRPVPPAVGSPACGISTAGRSGRTSSTATRPRGIKTPRPNDKRTPVLSTEDLRGLLHSCKGRDFVRRRDAAIIFLFLDCGLRLCELAVLRVDDVDIRGRIVYVEGKGSNRSGPRRRAVRAGVKCAQALDRYLRERRRSDRTPAGAGRGDKVPSRRVVGREGSRASSARRSRQPTGNADAKPMHVISFAREACASTRGVSGSRCTSAPCPEVA
jgi:hypothetical protein